MFTDMTGKQRRLRATWAALLGAVALVGCAGEPVIETVEVEVVPEVCLDALDLADTNLEALVDLADFYAGGGADTRDLFRDATSLDDVRERARARNEDRWEIEDRLEPQMYAMAAAICRNRAR